MSRRMVVILVSVVVVALLAVLAGPPLYSRWQESRNPDPITLTSAPAAPPAAGPFDPDGTWTVGAGSEETRSRRARSRKRRSSSARLSRFPGSRGSRSRSR